MKKIGILTIFLVIISSTGLLAAQSNCTFWGKINNNNLKNVTCKVELAGSIPYILATGTYKDRQFMIDISGIKNNIGKHIIGVSIMKYNGSKMLKRYGAKSKLSIKKHPKDSNARYFVTKLNAKSNDGKNIKFAMGVSWFKSDLPSTSKNLDGKLSQKFGNTYCKASKTKIQSWNDGYQIQKLFKIKAGETATTTLTFPKLKAGLYKNKGTSLTIMHMSMVNGKLKVNTLKSQMLRVMIIKMGKKYIIRYNGTVKGKTGIIKVRGVFKQ